MTEMILEALQDAFMDTVKLIPFLFATYIVMEVLERKASNASVNLLQKFGRFSPAVGAAVGVVPQCGFSAAAASLYSGGLISIGTLLAVFLSTSDEMLPIFISERVPAASVLKILLTKAFIGAGSGVAGEVALRCAKSSHRTGKHI